MNRKRIKHLLSVIVISCLILISGCDLTKPPTTQNSVEQNNATSEISSSKNSNYEDYNGPAYEERNNNKPEFTKDEITTKSYEYYSDLDELGRCGMTIACIGQDLMPTEKRGSIGMIKPTGWHTVKYDFVDGKYLYNRCHLIGYQLSGENANEKNLITGTRYFNTIGMLPFENQVADYVKETNNHVMYRVIPIFENDDLVAKGVTMEAYSVEDNGQGVSFNVFVYNIQPGVAINYHTGESRLTEENEESIISNTADKTFIVNKNTKKFHTADCEKVKDMSAKNKKTYKCTAQELIDQGYTLCQTCHPENS